jgi:hypothetical protein
MKYDALLAVIVAGCANFSVFLLRPPPSLDRERASRPRSCRSLVCRRLSSGLRVAPRRSPKAWFMSPTDAVLRRASRRLARKIELAHPSPKRRTGVSSFQCFRCVELAEVADSVHLHAPSCRGEWSIPVVEAHPRPCVSKRTKANSPVEKMARILGFEPRTGANETSEEECIP